MVLLDRIINRVEDNVLSESGKFLTNELKKSTKRIRNWTNCYQWWIKNGRAKQSAELPTHCSHCGAPIKKNIVFEYCECKIVE